MKAYKAGKVEKSDKELSGIYLNTITGKILTMNYYDENDSPYVKEPHLVYSYPKSAHSYSADREYIKNKLNTCEWIKA